MINENGVLVNIDDEGVCRIKLVGEIRYDSSAKGFIEFVNSKLVDKNVRDVIIDSHACDYIDSTNIGILVQIAAVQERKGMRKPTLFYSEDSKIYDAINDVNINPFFDVRFCDDTGYQFDNYEPLHKSETTKLEIAKIMYSTHKALWDVNETNKKKFDLVVDYLKKEVKRNGG